LDFDRLQRNAGLPLLLFFFFALFYIDWDHFPIAVFHLRVMTRASVACPQAVGLSHTNTNTNTESERSIDDVVDHVLVAVIFYLPFVALLATRIFSLSSKAKEGKSLTTS